MPAPESECTPSRFFVARPTRERDTPPERGPVLHSAEGRTTYDKTVARIIHFSEAYAQDFRGKVLIDLDEAMELIGEDQFEGTQGARPYCKADSNLWFKERPNLKADSNFALHARVFGFPPDVLQWLCSPKDRVSKYFLFRFDELVAAIDEGKQAFETAI